MSFKCVSKLSSNDNILSSVIEKMCCSSNFLDHFNRIDVAVNPFYIELAWSYEINVKFET